MRAGAVLQVIVVPGEQIMTPLGFLALGPGMREAGVLKVTGVPVEEVMTPGKFLVPGQRRALAPCLGLLGGLGDRSHTFGVVCWGPGCAEAPVKAQNRLMHVLWDY